MSILKKQSRNSLCFPNACEFQDVGNLRQITVPAVMQLSSDINRFVVGHCPNSSANNQACMSTSEK